jgi:hypothetical protein
VSPARVVENLIPGLAEAPGLLRGTRASIVTSGPCDYSCLRATPGLAHVITIEESWVRIRASSIIVRTLCYSSSSRGKDPAAAATICLFLPRSAPRPSYLASIYLLIYLRCANSVHGANHIIVTTSRSPTKLIPTCHFTKSVHIVFINTEPSSTPNEPTIANKCRRFFLTQGHKHVEKGILEAS